MEKNLKKIENKPYCEKPEILPSNEEIRKWQELIGQKFYKYEKYRKVSEIEKENTDILLSNFRSEIKEMQNEIKKSIIDKSKENAYHNRTAILNLDPDFLTLEEAKIWEQFKLIENFDDFRYFKRLVYEPYQKKLKEEIYQEIESDVNLDVLASPGPHKDLIEKIKKNFAGLSKWDNPDFVGESENEFAVESLRKAIFFKNPRVTFGWKLMGNRLPLKALVLDAEENLDELKESGSIL